MNTKLPETILLPPVDVPPRVVLETIKQRQATNTDLRRGTRLTSSINVALAIDGNYVAHTAATMSAMLDMLDRATTIRFFLLTNQTLSQQDRVTLSAIFPDCNLHFIDVDANEFTWAPLNRPHISVAAFYRLNMHKLLPSDIERVIYIDSDTIVVDSLLKLWNIDIGSKPIAGCADEGGVTQSIRLNLPLSHKYFNSGVMIFDLAKLRKSKLMDDIANLYQAREKEIILQDQDLLNIMFYDRTHILPLKWNINNVMFAFTNIRPSYSVEDAREAVADPGIIHFTGRIKPWDTRCVNPLAGLYWHYRNMTPWRESAAQLVVRSIREPVRASLSPAQRRLNKWYRQAEAAYSAQAAMAPRAADRTRRTI
jgi:lipopolysaccharide biosynthesis glycosyltransferase